MFHGADIPFKNHTLKLPRNLQKLHMHTIVCRNINYFRPWLLNHCCTVKNMTSHLMYLYFPFVSNSAVIGYNFHFVFNSLNSAEGASTLNDVSVIIVYSITLFKLFDEWHLTFYDLKLFYQLIRNEFNNFFFNDVTRINEVFQSIFPLILRLKEKSLNLYLNYLICDTLRPLYNL